MTDAARKWKTFTNDVLGNLVSVAEPDPANQPGGTLTTSYTYDWMNHLSGVTMPRSSATQTRTFIYDDAGRLTSAMNPENGTVSYYYNSNNTLQYKHDAKGQDTVYTYDTQNRVTEIQRYANGKNNAEDMCQRVIYSYDTNPYDSNGTYRYTTGRLAAAVYPVCNVLDSNGNVSVTEMYSYHPAGAGTIKHLHIYKPWLNNNTEGTFFPRRIFHKQAPHRHYDNKLQPQARACGRPYSLTEFQLYEHRSVVASEKAKRPLRTQRSILQCS